ncbi:MAG: hypothetical protein NTW16_05530 [Bacteroidetes bacterium]|nr:hypothetical protein [Bacteroidota bacterium]
MEIEILIQKINSEYIWDKKPVFCFTSDVDWASEDVMKEYFKIIKPFNIKPTLFLTHHSDIIEENYLAVFNKVVGSLQNIASCLNMETRLKK